MATSAGTRISLPPPYLTDDAEWKRALGRWALEANQGHLANTGTVTLTANVASTTVTDARVGVGSFIGFMPTTASAATEFGAGTLFVSTQGKQTFTITHVNAATADRTFRYAILG
jgi:hypothetical protein